MNIFKKKYTLRSYTKQKTKKGYVGAEAYTDRMVSLDVQPVVEKQLQTLEEGQRQTKGVVSYGEFPIKTANVKTGERADRLFFAGEWYECLSSVFFEHTPLSHWKSTFVCVPESSNAEPDVTTDNSNSEAVTNESI